MSDHVPQDLTIHISSKSHLNVTFNLHQCGWKTLAHGAQLALAADDAFTMLYVYGGNACIAANGIEHVIGIAEGFFAFPDQAYTISHTGAEPLAFIWLNFSGYSVERYLNRTGIHRAVPVFTDESGHIGTQFRALYEASQRMPNRYCRMMSLLYDIFYHMIDRNNQGHTTDYVDSANLYAVRAVDFIEHHFGQNISVGDIAAAVGIARKQLYAVFQNVLKMPPKQYLIYYRIERASIRLKATTDAIQTIAESVGYASQFYFAKEFKRIMGVTPSAYRKTPHVAEVFIYRLYGPMLRAAHAGEARAIFTDVKGGDE